MSDTARRDREIPAAVVDWYELHRASLTTSGIQVRLSGPTTGRSKDSVAIDFSSPQLIVTMEVWDSGECDVATLDVGKDPEGDPIWDVVSLSGGVEAQALLDRIAARYLGTT